MASTLPHLIICGHGWLGGQVADKLASSATLTGTTRDETKASEMRARGIATLHYSLGDSTASLIQNAENATLLLNIPAGRRQQDLSDYQQQMCDLVIAFSKTRLRHLVFISTTSVYGEQIDGTVTETTPVAPETASAHANAAIEACIQTYLPDRYSILRLAGLTGPGRHPVNMLAGRTLDNGNKRINLVHSSDAVTAIAVLFRRGPAQRILHLCSTRHPKRGDYYTACAAKLQLPAPVFHGTENTASGKTIDATATLRYLGISLLAPDPDAMC